ncbi:MAG: hypothetical protein LUG99_12055 [Lachnospiraceae bacterium]|nr:hypothetical protein [Lachnospiraceae bacterium]
MKLNMFYQDQMPYHSYTPVQDISRPIEQKSAQDDLLSREVQKQQIKTMGSWDREQNKRSIQLEEAQGKADIDLRKSFELEKIRTAANVERAKELANVQSCRELQQTEVQVSTDGKIMITRELFGEDKKQKADFQVMADSRVLICENNGKGVLYAIFRNSSGKEREVILPLSQTDAKTIEQKFTAAGIGFKFSRKRNLELLIKLVQTLIENLPTAGLPLRSGWQKNAMEEWEYVPTEILTWEEIENAKL